MDLEERLDLDEWVVETAAGEGLPRGGFFSVASGSEPKSEKAPLREPKMGVEFLLYGA